MSVEEFHRLLLAGIHGTTGDLRRVLRGWVCCLLNRHDGAALKRAAGLGHLEALEALVSAGGPSAAAAAPFENGQDAAARGCLLCSCAARNDCAALPLGPVGLETAAY